MLEPDEDEDPTRICAKCEQRPRWSRNHSCTRCVICAGKAVRWCILRRKKEPVTAEQRAGNLRTKRAIYRARYRQLRALGLPSREATTLSRGRAKYLTALKACKV